MFLCLLSFYCLIVSFIICPLGEGTLFSLGPSQKDGSNSKTSLEKQSDKCQRTHIHIIQNSFYGKHIDNFFFFFFWGGGGYTNGGKVIRS